MGPNEDHHNPEEDKKDSDFSAYTETDFSSGWCVREFLKCRFNFYRVFFFRHLSIILDDAAADLR